MAQAGTQLLHELLAKKREAELALDPNVNLLTFAERKRRQSAKYRKPEWLRTTKKTKDSRGKSQNLWHNAPPTSKRNTKTRAERASSYASSRKRDDRLAERRAESVMRNRAKNRNQQKAVSGDIDEDDDISQGNQHSLIPEIMVSWTLPDPLPDTMDTWRGKRRKQGRKGSERRAFITLCSEIRKRMGTSGVHLFDEHPANVQYDVADIAEAVWTIEPRVRRACAKRSDAISDTFFSLEKIVEEKKSQQNALTLMENELDELDQKRKDALEKYREKVEQPSIKVLRDVIGQDFWPAYLKTLNDGLRKIRAVVIRTPGTLEAIDKKIETALAAQENQDLKGMSSDTFQQFLHTIAADVGASDFRPAEQEVEQMMVHFSTHPDHSVNTEEFMRSVRSSHTLRQTAVNEAYTWLKALIEHAYERTAERTEVANSSCPTADGHGSSAPVDLNSNDELCNQVRFMYKRHLVSQSQGSGRKSEASVGADIAKYAHLLDDWLTTLPPPDVELDIPRIVPHASWSLYYAVLGDSIEDDGQFLSMMTHAWGVRAGRKAAAQWDALRRKLHAYEQLELGLQSAERKFNERLEALRALPELCLSGQSVSWVAPIIRELQQLQMFWLDHNAIRAIPEHLADLGNLTFLQLDGNMIEKLPPELAQLSNLRKLFLRHNRMQSPKFSFPMQLQDLQDLQELQLGHNRFSSLPPCFAKLPRLRVLGMEHNHLHGVPGEVLGQMKGLQHLALNNNDLTILPAEVGQLCRLRTLHLHENAIRRLPRTFSELTNLQSLSLHNNCLRMASAGEKGSAVWPKLGRSLTSVSLHGNELEELPRSLLCFEKLATISLQDNMFLQIPPGLRECRNCSELNLASNQLRMPFELRDMLTGRLGGGSGGGNSGNNGEARVMDANLSQYTEVLQGYFATRGGVGDLFASTVNEAVLDQVGVQREHQALLLRLIESYRRFVPKPSFLTPGAAGGDGMGGGMGMGMGMGMGAASFPPSQIPPGMPAGPFASSMDKLEVLHLNDNQLGWLPRGLGLVASTLRVLFLQDNALTALPGDLGDLVHLRVINCARNKLTSLPLSLLKLHRLSEVHLVGNPFPPPLDQVVATSAYVSPLEVDFDRAMRKLTKAMALQLKAIAVDEARSMSSFSPQPGRAAVEMLFRRVDSSRTGIVSERELRDCLTGRRYDFRGVTITPAEVESVVEMVFYHGLGRERLAGQGEIDEAIASSVSNGVTPKDAADAAVAAHLANASAGNIRLHELEFVQIVEAAMHRGTTSSMAQAMRKYLMVRRSSSNMQKHNVFSGATAIQARIRGFLQRRQPRLPGFTFAPPNRAEVGQREERKQRGSKKKVLEKKQAFVEEQRARREVEKLQRELEAAQREVRNARKVKKSEDDKQKQKLLRKREKVKEMKKTLRQVERHAELVSQKQKLKKELRATSGAVQNMQGEMNNDNGNDNGNGNGNGRKVAWMDAEAMAQKQQTRAERDRAVAALRAGRISGSVTKVRDEVRGSSSSSSGSTTAATITTTTTTTNGYRAGGVGGGGNSDSDSDDSDTFVFVDPVGGGPQSFMLPCSMSQTVLDVKEAIQDQEGPPANLQILLFYSDGGMMRLDDDRTLAECGVGHSSRLQLMVSS